ncbi:hypothetical protein EfmAA55_11340 [Enterococcus faecium]|nr:hypothetical protein EfmAA55_11340 [Enterococcus faecium]
MIVDTFDTLSRLCNVNALYIMPRIANNQIKVLGFPIDFYLYFDPYVMENGTAIKRKIEL